MFILVMASAASANYITLQVAGAPFTTNQAILFKGTLKDASGANRVADVNFYVMDTAGAMAAGPLYVGDKNGDYNATVAVTAVGDYNAFAVDLNTGKIAKLSFFVAPLDDIAIDFTDHVPPFKPGENLRFTLQGKDFNNNDTNIGEGFKVEIEDSSGNVKETDANVVTDGNWVIDFNLAGYAAGDYKIDINNGMKQFTVPVRSYKTFVSMVDATGTPAGTFAANSSPTLRIKLTNFDENETITPSSTPTVTVRRVGNTSSTDFSSSCGLSGSLYDCNVPSANTATAGEYLVTASVDYNSVTQTASTKFNISTYEMTFFTKKFEGGPMEKEKMPSVYPRFSTITFEAHIKNTGTDQEVTGSDLNSGFCKPSVLSLQKRPMTSTTYTDLDFSVALSDDNSFCQVTFAAPAVQSTYDIKATMDINGETLEGSGTLIIQDFLIFMQPVDTATASGKWDFYKGEAVGFTANIMDLNGGLNPAILRVTGARIFQRSGDKAVAYPDINWGAVSTSTGDKNIAILSSSVVNTLSGGFLPMAIYADVITSNNQADANSITAFAMFKLNTMQVTVSQVDENGSAKNSNFGPPSYNTDENVYMKVTVKDGANNAIAGAEVKPAFINNESSWSPIDTSGISTKYTDTNGVATLNLGQMGSSGRFFGEIEVVASDGNTDTAHMFFETLNFILFAQPIDATTGNRCTFKQAVKTDENVMFLLEARDPQTFNDINVSIADSEAITFKYFGTPSKPQFPPIEVPYRTYDVNSLYPCIDPFAGGPGGSDPKYRTVVTVAPTSAGWKSGFMDVSITGTDTSGAGRGTTNGSGFMMVQPFRFATGTGGFGFGEASIAKAGGTYDINVNVSADVNITAALTDFESFSKQGGGDLNIGTPGDCNAQGCARPLAASATKVEVSGTADPTEYTLISVKIPADAELKEYILSLTATNAAGREASQEVFLNVSLYRVLIPGYRQELLENGQLGQEPQNVREGYASIINDWNARGEFLGRIAYDTFAVDTTWDVADMDYNFLVDYNNSRVLVDIDDDGNFADQNWTGVGQDLNGLPENHPKNVRIVDVSNLGGGVSGGVKYIKHRDFNFTTSASGGSFAGNFPTDVNFYVPVFIKDLNGDPIKDAKVQVTNIMSQGDGSFSPTPLSPSKWDSNADFTDKNGYAGLQVKTSSLLNFASLEIKVTTPGGASAQTLSPWQGPRISTKSVSTTVKLTGPVWQVDYNEALPTDFNISPAITPAQMPADSLMGIWREQGSRGRNLDGNTDPTTWNDTWYFLRTQDGNIYIDDDLDINAEIYDKTAQNFTSNKDANTANGLLELGRVPEIISLGAGALASAYSSVWAGTKVIYQITSESGMNQSDYWEDAYVDTNVLDDNLMFYRVHTYTDTSTGPSVQLDGGIGVLFTVNDLNGEPTSRAVTVTSVKLRNTTTGTTYTIDNDGYTSVTNGVLRIPLSSDANAFTSGWYTMEYDYTVAGNTKHNYEWFAFSP